MYLWTFTIGIMGQFLLGDVILPAVFCMMIQHLLLQVSTFLFRLERVWY